MCQADSDFALKLAEDLEAGGARVWIDQLDIEPGTPWDRTVEGALVGAPCMLVILSPVSVASDNVRDEISFALSKQKRIIPVLYRDCEVPFRLARLQHIDFRNDYERGLKSLIKALGADRPPARPGPLASLSSQTVPPTETPPLTIDQVVEARAETQASRRRKWAKLIEGKRQLLGEVETEPIRQHTPTVEPAHKPDVRPVTAAKAQKEREQVSSSWRGVLRRHWKWLLPFPAAGLVAFIVFLTLGSSEVARLAFARAQSNPAVMR